MRITHEEVREVLKAVRDECVADAAKPYPVGCEEFARNTLSLAAWHFMVDVDFSQRVTDRLKEESHA